jgi:hypothetical protein
MGKIVTIYLSNDEASDLKDFCDENQCTQYSALKTAVRQILSKPMQQDEVDIPEEMLEDPEEDAIPDEDVPDEIVEELGEEMNEDTVKNSDDSLMRWLLRLRKAREKTH